MEQRTIIIAGILLLIALLGVGFYIYSKTFESAGSNPNPSLEYEKKFWNKLSDEGINATPTVNLIIPNPASVDGASEV